MGEKGGGDGKRGTFKIQERSKEQSALALLIKDKQTFTMDHYPTPNSVLIETLKLQKHPEGGYFVETDRQPAAVPSPFAGELARLGRCRTNSHQKRLTDNEPRSLSTAIYYLLTHDSPDGAFHMNKSFASHSRILESLIVSDQGVHHRRTTCSTRAALSTPSSRRFPGARPRLKSR
jgi:hypothetical protein